MRWNVPLGEFKRFLLTLSEKEAKAYEMRRIYKNKKKPSYQQMAQVLNLTEEEVKQLLGEVQNKLLIAFIEEPVRRATALFLSMDSTSSGFHTGFSKSNRGIEPSWAIVFKDKISSEIKNVAIKAGLKINERYVYKGTLGNFSYGYVTDVYLPNVSEKETAKAKKVFDKFADFYIQTTRRK